MKAFKKGNCKTYEIRSHVVYNQGEVEHTLVDFFFEDDSNRDSLVRAKGVRLVSVDEKRDWCVFICKVADKADANRVMTTLSSIPREYTLPKYLDIAWCVSHPHGSAQRVSIGSIQSVEDAKPDEGSEELQLLAGKCCDELSFNLRKVCFVYYNVVGIERRLFFVDDPSKSPTKQAKLTHLETKGLIREPEPEETEYIEKELSNIRGTLTKKTEEAFTQQYSSEVMDDVVKKRVKEELFKGILETEVSLIKVSKEIIERYHEIEGELNAKQYHMMTGKDLRGSHRSRVESLLYSLATCPGCSGARIRAYKFCPGETDHEGKPTKGSCNTETIKTMSPVTIGYYGQHSKGIGNHGSMSGGANSFFIKHD